MPWVQSAEDWTILLDVDVLQDIHGRCQLNYVSTSLKNLLRRTCSIGSGQLQGKVKMVAYTVTMSLLSVIIFFPRGLEEVQ